MADVSDQRAGRPRLSGPHARGGRRVSGKRGLAFGLSAAALAKADAGRPTRNGFTLVELSPLGGHDVPTGSHTRNHFRLTLLVISLIDWVTLWQAGASVARKTA